MVLKKNMCLKIFYFKFYILLQMLPERGWLFYFFLAAILNHAKKVKRIF